jgi:hypothetical protein
MCFRVTAATDPRVRSDSIEFRLREVPGNEATSLVGAQTRVPGCACNIACL